MNSWTSFVVLLDFNSCVHFWSGGSTKQKRNFKSSLLELLSVEDHLVKWWGDQTREANNVCIFPDASIYNWLARAHDTHIYDFVVIATKYDTYNILSDIMDISFNCS